MAHGGPDALSEALHSDLNAHPYPRGFDIVHDVFELSPGAFGQRPLLRSSYFLFSSTEHCDYRHIRIATRSVHRIQQLNSGGTL